MSNTATETSSAEASPKATRQLRCVKTHRYFTGNSWSEDPNQAQAFPDALEAVRACVTNDLHEVELVLRAPVTGTVLFTTQLR